jgi:hypothetical protein
MQHHSFSRIHIKVVDGATDDLVLIFDADPFSPLGPQIENCIKKAKTSLLDNPNLYRGTFPHFHGIVHQPKVREK